MKVSTIFLDRIIASNVLDNDAVGVHGLTLPPNAYNTSTMPKPNFGMWVKDFAHELSTNVTWSFFKYCILGLNIGVNLNTKYNLI